MYSVPVVFITFRRTLEIFMKQYINSFTKKDSQISPVKPTLFLETTLSSYIRIPFSMGFSVNFVSLIYSSPLWN